MNYKGIIKQNNIIIAGIVAIPFYWIFESVLHVVIFHDTNFIDQLLFPEPHEIWMRSFVAAFLIVLGVYIQLRVTERKKAEETLMESEGRYRSFMETLTDAVVSIDEDQAITFWNPAAESILGYMEDEVLGKSLEIVVPDKYLENHKKGVKRYLKTGKPKVVGKTVELEAKRKDGKIIPIELSLSVDKLKERYNFTGIIRNITERKEAEKEIQLKEENLRLLIDSSQDCICHISLDGKFLSMSAAGCRLNELDSKDELIGKNCTTGIVENLDEVEKGVKRALEGKTMSLQYKSVGKKGRKISWDSVITPVRDNNGEITSILRISRDITDKKFAEKKLKKAHEELKSLDTLKSDIIANVSHELRTPITIISASLDLIKNEEDKKERRELIIMAKDALNRQNRIVSDLIAATEMKLGNMDIKVSSFPINDLINLSVLDFETRGSNLKAKIVIQLEEDLPMIMGDFDQLKHAIQNLLNNAIKFNKGNEDVLIEAKKKKSIIEVCVTDKGIGMSPKHIKKIFDPLYQADSSAGRSYEGTGMGLAIVFKIIEAQGGKIWAESEEGRGSKFYFTLPTDNKGASRRG